MKMKNKEIFKDIYEYILSLFFPNRCIFCGQLIPPFDEICDNCEKSLPWIKGEICHFCGSGKEFCSCKKRHGHFYDEIISPLYYVDSVRKCIHDMKFHDERRNAEVFAKLMNRIRLTEYSDVHFDYIAYIPMLEKQKRKRGYNQGELLANKLSEVSSIPVCKDLIVKLYETKTQHRCVHGIERYGNVLGAYDINPDININGKTVLLVDDVKTTGATLNECAKMLQVNGANAVYCITASLMNRKYAEKTEEEGTV